MTRKPRPAAIPCAGFVATTGHWRRCTQPGTRRIGHFGIYCPKHAQMADRTRVAPDARARRGREDF